MNQNSLEKFSIQQQNKKRDKKYFRKNTLNYQMFRHLYFSE